MKKFVVLPHDPKWGKMFEEERDRLLSELGDVVISIHHIGSTSISGIYAKPVIDMLAEVRAIEQMDTKNPVMTGMGYEVMGEFGITGRRYFRKYINGNRTFQIHTFQAGSDEIDRHIAFRDYLVAHPDDARVYSDLKKELILKYDGDPDDYINGKNGFIKEIDRKAKLMRSRHSG